MHLKAILFIGFLGMFTLVTAQQNVLEVIKPRDHSYVRRGNKAYEDGKFAEAETFYKKALASNRENEAGNFNLGDALYEQGRYEEAAQQFSMTANMAEGAIEKAKAFHNMGNAQLKDEKFKESVESYKQALRHNPKDEDTRYNLAYALHKMRQQQEQENKEDQENKDQEKDKDKEQDENKDNKDSKENKENEDKGDKEQENKDKGDEGEKDEKSDEGDPKDHKGAQEGEQQERKMSKEEIERMLEALRYQEEKLQKDLQKRKVQGKRVRVEKDW